MEQSMQRELRRLRIFAYGATGLLAALTLTAFAQAARRTRFEEIDVERINIIEKSGQVRMVISNKARSPGPQERGVPFAYPGGGRPGLIYYNDEGTEAGGLTFRGSRDSTGKYWAGSIFTLDQYEQDQTVALEYSDNNGRRFAGLGVADFPTNMSLKTYIGLWKQAQQIKDTMVRNDSLETLDRLWHGKGRLFAGRTRAGASQVLLNDATGAARLRLQVDSAGYARLEFLDAKGKVTRTINDSVPH